MPSTCTGASRIRRRWLTCLRYEELASRAYTVVVRGQSMRTPCPVDALLLACVHRAAHHDLSDELLWLYDIHLLAQRFIAGEWGDFVARASRSQVRVAVCRRSFFGPGVLSHARYRKTCCRF